MASGFKKNLGELLIEKGIIDKNALEEAIAIQKKTGKRLGKILQEKGLIDEKTLYTFLEEQLEINFKTKIEDPPKPEVFQYIPYKYCRKKNIAPYDVNNKTIKIYTSEPSNINIINEISFMTGKVVEVSFASEGAIQEFLNKFIDDKNKIPFNIKDKDFSQVESKKEEENNLDDSPVVRYVDETIRNAIERNVSDIHFECYEKKSVLRYRIDGVLYVIDEPDIKMMPAIISRIKILAELDISEKRLPQDGRIMLRYEDRPIDIRVSIIPTVFGENAVLRILDKGKKTFTLEELGLNKNMIELIKKEARKPYGMILVTGPTGSGKTTTLYAVLQYIKQFENKILTIEDPIEYQIDGISQVQVHSEIGLTFAAGLRAFLRHDPDVIMVGEIRDKETADIAVRAALTGHLVLSTVHTNDAVSSITRFIDMGIPPYLLTSTINLVIAQRLVRKICDNCKSEIKVKPEDLKSFGIPETLSDLNKIYFGKGCKNCNNSGFKGRVPVFEILKITEKFKDAVIKGASSLELKELAIKEGMITIRDFGLQLVREGITTIEEVEKIAILGD